MRPDKTYSHLYFVTFLLTTVYPFIVVAHLFFAPQFQVHTSGRHSFKRINDLAYILIRTNRSTFVESKTGKVFQKKSTIAFTSVLAHPKPLLHTLYGNDHISQFSSDLHLSYLTNRTLRI
jgi:hypothetical protein